MDRSLRKVRHEFPKSSDIFLMDQTVAVLSASLQPCVDLLKIQTRLLPRCRDFAVKINLDSQRLTFLVFRPNLKLRQHLQGYPNSLKRKRCSHYEQSKMELL